MGIFSRKMQSHNLGEVNIATPAEHIVQLDSEQSLGTNVLKGFTTGLLSFGERQNLFQMLEVISWGYSHPYFPFKTEDLYISCKGWIAFKIDKSNAPLWESWLSHNHPK
jgi:hypothetical protein